MDEICGNFVNGRVCYDEYNGELTIPKVFETFKEDFGGSDASVVEWIWYYYASTDDTVEDVLEGLKKKNILIRYSEEA